MPSPYAPVREVTRDERLARYVAHRMVYLPIALDNARRKVRALETEAARYGMTDLLEVGEHG